MLQIKRQLMGKKIRVSVYMCKCVIYNLKIDILLSILLRLSLIERCNNKRRIFFLAKVPSLIFTGSSLIADVIFLGKKSPSMNSYLR